MTPRELIHQTASAFRDAGIPDPDYDASLLLANLLHRPPLSLRLDTDTALQNDVIEAYRDLCARRLGREPLQYILREAPFMGAMLRVDPRVLIPRPETELLCEWALAEMESIDHPRVLDLCCGSGCIGLSIRKARPDAEVFLTDISPDALDVATMNARELGLRVVCTAGDLFTGVPGQKFHLIISNPPYIPSAECSMLQQEVLREPRLALDGGTDGLVFYRRICGEAPDHLYPGGILIMELGDGEAIPVKQLMLDAGFIDPVIRQDLCGRERMILGRVS